MHNTCQVISKLKICRSGSKVIIQMSVFSKTSSDQVDEDEDETIDFDEFMTVVEKSLSEMVTSNDIMDAFKLVDPSDTGSVNVTQLAEGLETSEVGITINDAVSILNDCVMSHDQVLTFTEFRRLITDDTHHG